MTTTLSQGSPAITCLLLLSAPKARMGPEERDAGMREPLAPSDPLESQDLAFVVAKAD